MNQFIYIATIADKEYKASLNINKLIRSMSNEDGTLTVILDDFHERVRQEPDIDLKTNKMRGYKNVRETVQSEIILNSEDAERFFKLTEYVR